MLIALPLAILVVGLVAWRLGDDGAGGRRAFLAVAGLALGIRLLATFAVWKIAEPIHITGVWLNDEASFFLATQSLLPNPLDRALPQGLDHLGGDGYLGLITVLSIFGGDIADANAFRVVNAALGTIVVILSMLIARRFFGTRAALLTGVLLAVWPTLVLWSATMLRDTMGGFTVVVVWWALVHARELGWVRTAGSVFLALVIVLGLRPYLGGAVVAGVLAWAIYPFVRQLTARTLLLVAAGTVAGAVVLGVVFAKRIDYATHELFYRQTVTRIETLGRLYADAPPATSDQPMKPGAAVGLVEANGWVLGGVVQSFPQPRIAQVAFTDESVREVPVSDLVPLQSTTLPPLELVAWIAPNLGSYLGGSSLTSDASSPVWIAVALVWDALLLLAVVTVLRGKLAVRQWVFPLCVVVGTVLALVAVPGAPGNADRHRSTQTLPLLLVVAAALVADLELARRRSGFAVASMSTSAPTDAAPASSRMRSAR